jgi:hypothetical protein
MRRPITDIVTQEPLRTVASAAGSLQSDGYSLRGAGDAATASKNSKSPLPPVPGRV